MSLTLVLSTLQVESIISQRQKEPYSSTAPVLSHQLKTFILGFSKGGTVINQLVTELAYLEAKPTESAVVHTKGQPPSQEFSTVQEGNQIIPRSIGSLLNSITDIHYIDVGLNSPGAYITDYNVIERIGERTRESASGIRFLLHGTPRQWCDTRRDWIRDEKDKLVHLLESVAKDSRRSFVVQERFYFADRSPDMQMHFEIIESMDVC